MAIQKSKVKMPLGMQTLDFWPIKSEPDTGHHTYDTSVNLGAAVKGSPVHHHGVRVHSRRRYHPAGRRGVHLRSAGHRNHHVRVVRQRALFGHTFTEAADGAAGGEVSKRRNILCLNISLLTTERSF